jgi:hypothetical protein
MGMVVCFTGIPIFIWFWKRKLPKAARTIFWASLRGLPLILLCHDSGRGELTTITERKGEGIVITAQGKYKILPRWMPKLPWGEMQKRADEAAKQKAAAAAIQAEKEAGETTAESQDTASPSVPHPASLEQVAAEHSGIDLSKILRQDFMLDYSDWIVKRTFLVGLNLPFFVGYTGKLCLLNPEALALYEAGEMMIKGIEGTLFNPNQEKKPDGSEKSVDDALQPLMLLDGRKIQQIIYNGFDQSQVAGVVADSEEIARIGQGMSPKTKIILMIILIAIVAGAALFFLPQIIGYFQQQQGKQAAGMAWSALKRLFRM